MKFVAFTWLFAIAIIFMAFTMFNDILVEELDYLTWRADIHDTPHWGLLWPARLLISFMATTGIYFMCVAFDAIKAMDKKSKDPLPTKHSIVPR